MFFMPLIYLNLIQYCLISMAQLLTLEFRVFFSKISGEDGHFLAWYEHHLNKMTASWHMCKKHFSFVREAQLSWLPLNKIVLSLPSRLYVKVCVRTHAQVYLLASVNKIYGFLRSGYFRIGLSVRYFFSKLKALYLILFTQKECLFS